ncbi:hypothetical protein [Glutamicibacter nicotianae]|uniref:hypothetical protein n=1 Tax=Glutamicibacter nicotianae TaxID=37929 RepID=UPI00195D75F5|nr:hypothetical protein [Glutamicibacter nicotianae]MBM7767368.1 hypothetical protein [Glutamicibacter nicotianae]
MAPEAKDLIIQRQANQIGSLMFENTSLSVQLEVTMQELNALRKEKAEAVKEDG